MIRLAERADGRRVTDRLASSWPSRSPKNRRRPQRNLRAFVSKRRRPNKRLRRRRQRSINSADLGRRHQLPSPALLSLKAIESRSNCPARPVSVLAIFLIRKRRSDVASTCSDRRLYSAASSLHFSAVIIVGSSLKQQFSDREHAGETVRETHREQQSSDRD